MHASPQEMECIGRILAGERELFHTLIRPYERTVYMAALSLLHEPADAEDAAQESMLRLTADSLTFAVIRNSALGLSRLRSMKRDPGCVRAKEW